MARRKIIAGNWKMNMTPTEAVALVETLKPLVAGADADIVYGARSTQRSRNSSRASRAYSPVKRN